MDLVVLLPVLLDSLNAPVLFAGFVVLAIGIYVLADGFDLGIGILFLLAPRNADRDLMMGSIEPVWDGNETWLVMGGTLLLGAFPAAYYILLPALYLPILFMLFGLILRGISFSFRLQTVRFRRAWDYAFSGGSVLAALCQGFVLGGVISPIPVTAHAFAGGPFQALTPLGLLCGIGVLGGYALLGAGWLIWKTEGPTQIFAREVGHAALLVATGAIVAVSGWTALTDPAVAARWFSWPNIAFLAPAPILTALVVWALWRSLWGNNETLPFRLAICLFLLGFGGLIVSLWPYIVPRSLTIWDGAADPKTLAFVGVGAVCIIPIVIAYQLHAYWVFRGKTRTDH